MSSILVTKSSLDHRVTRRRKPLQQTRHDSYRRGLVYRWLNEGVRASDDEAGQVVKLLRRRIDMPPTFPTKTHLYNYLLKAGVHNSVAGRAFDRLWTLYRRYYDHSRHDAGLTT